MKVKEALLISDGEARSVMWNDQKRPHYVNGSIIRDRHLLILLIFVALLTRLIVSVWVALFI